MATDGPDPTPCDKDIFERGFVVYQTHGVSSNRMEGWIKRIAFESGQPVDWHFAAGYAIVKGLGDLKLIEAAVANNLHRLAELRAETSAHTPADLGGAAK